MQQTTIVVVEADPAVRDLFDELLQDAGYGVRLCELSALHPARLVAAAPDLVMVEITPFTAPTLLALFRELRSRPDTERLPVLVSTTDRQLFDRVGGDLRRLGCEVMLKPFGISALLETVDRSLAPAERR